MELNHLRYFYEVAKSGSFTEAARRLHISQSALSRAVAQLEDQEGVKLFSRGKRGVTLTAIGTEVFERSRQVFAAINEIQDAIRGKKSVPEGYLRFGASDHIIQYILIDRIQEMLKEFSKITPSVITGGPNEICASILNNESEFGLFFTKLNIPQLVYEPLVTLDMAIVHKPEIRPKAGKPGMAALRNFIEEHGYISSVGSQYMHHPSAGFVGQLGGFPRLLMECNGQEAQKKVCKQIGGIAYLARFIVEQDLREGTLVEYALPKPFQLTIHLAQRRGRMLSLNARTFIERLKAFYEN